jgi:hypothetical protein
MMRQIAAWVALIAGLCIARPQAQPAASRPDPLAGLPSWTRLLLSWGQRPEWEADSRHLLFMEKAFGDAYRIDIATGRVEPVTTHFFHEGFDRIHQLANGDYLLTGTRSFEAADPWRTRHRLEMFVLDRRLDKPAVPLHEFIDEGPAVSARDMRIAWTAPGQRDMYTGDIAYTDGVPSLAGKRLLLSYAARPYSDRLETQDFRPPDERELIFTCYSGTEDEPFYYGEVCGLDLASGAVRNYTNTPEEYDEAEGVFPDGRFTIVESDRHTREKRKWRIDLYRLALDGSNRSDRLTFFEGIEGPYHGSNGDVSPDGRYLAVQLGIHGMGAGQGRGLMLIDLGAWEASRAAQ